MFDHFLRRIVRWYCRRVPFHKGKTRLVTWAFQHIRMPAESVRDSLRNGMSVEINPAEWIQNEIYYTGYYEIYLAEFFRKLVKPDWVFADVGAHIGQYSLIAAACGAQVHTFEPNPENFASLQKNVVLNHLSNIALNPVAVSNRAGTSFFELPVSSNTGVGSLTLQDARTNHSIPVTTVTLDGYFQGNGVLPHLIKMDVEGAEMLVLQGAHSTLQAAHPILIIEADENCARRFGYSIRQLTDELQVQGYQFYLLKRARLEPVRAIESIHSENLIAMSRI